MIKRALIIVLVVLSLSLVILSVRAAPIGKWTTKAPLPQERADAPAVTYNNTLYFFGGYQDSDSGQTSTVYAYNPSTNTWTQEASMNIATWGSAAAVYNGVAYVFGGVDGANDLTVQAYNFATNSWTTKNNLPANLAGQGEMAVTTGSAIYVFGGWSGTSAYSYNPSTDTYAQLANIPYSTRWGTCAYVNVNGQDQIYLMGGFNATTGSVNTMYYYTPTYNNWTYAGITPYPAYGGLRDDPVINGSIYFGYGQDNGVYYSSLYSYNPNTATWSSALPNGTYPRDGVACGVINYKLYVVGGRNSSLSEDILGLNYNEQFDPQTQLEVTIDPPQITMYLKQSQTFTSTVTAGTAPYSYLWVLNGTSINGANNSSWTFTPTQAGNYNVYVNVTDSVNNKTQSNIVTIQVFAQCPLTMSTNYGTTSPPNGTYDFGSTVSISSTSPIATAGERYIWLGWEGTGTGSYSGMNNQAQIMMNGAVTEVAQWEHQYSVTFASSGLGLDAQGTVVTVNDSDNYVTDMPFTMWVDSGSSVNFSYLTTVSSITTGQQYTLNDVNASSALVITSPTTVTASYIVQYYLTVTSAYNSASGSGWYDSGSTAYAALNHGISSGGSGTRYVFINWNNDASGTNYAQSNPIIMDGPKTATTQWATQYKITLSQTGVGSDFSGAYLIVNGTQYGNGGFSTWAYSNDVYTFSYTPLLVVTPDNEQYLLTEISGNTTDSFLTVLAPSIVNGAYETQYYLNVTSVYGTVSGTGWYDSGASANAIVTPITVAGPVGTQYVFTGWSPSTLGSSSTSNTINMTGPMTASAIWQTQYYLTVSSTYGTPDGAGWYNSSANAYVSVSPTTVPGATGIQYVFTGWSGNATGTSSTSNPILMSGPATATVIWQTQYYLNVSSAYGTTGGSGFYNSGTNVSATVSSLTVAGATGTQYVFTGWSGDASSTTSPSNAIIMNGPNTATANWKTQYYLNVTSVYGMVSGTGWYDSGASANAIVTPIIVAGPTGTQYVFIGWSGDASGNSSASSTFIVSSPKIALADWKTQYLVTFAINPSGSAITSPSGTNVWEDLGTIQLSVTPFIGYTFNSWFTDSGNLTIGNANSATTSATINGPGTITANLATNPRATPILTQTSQSPTPSSAPSPSPNPTTSPTPTPTNSTTIHRSAAFTQNITDFIEHFQSLVVATVIIGVLAVIVVIRKYK